MTLIYMLSNLEKRIILIKDYSLSSLRKFKNEILEDSEKAKYNDLEDVVYRFQLTYDEIIVILDLKFNPKKTNRVFLEPRRI